MKVNRWIVLTAIALLAVGVIGAIAYNAYAQAPTPDGDEVSESQDQAGITREEAEAIALAQYPGAKVSATELEKEGNILLYSIELDNGAEVEVNANDGTILPAEAETNVENGS